MKVAVAKTNIGQYGPYAYMVAELLTECQQV